MPNPEGGPEMAPEAEQTRQLFAIDGWCYPRLYHRRPSELLRHIRTLHNVLPGDIFAMGFFMSQLPRTVRTVLRGHFFPDIDALAQAADRVMGLGFEPLLHEFQLGRQTPLLKCCTTNELCFNHEKYGAIAMCCNPRFILMRRFFSISGTIFLLRCVTMLITSLSVPGKHLDCSPRPYGDMWQKLYNAYLIWSGAGMTLQGVRTCGDYMFSGHTVSLTLLNFFITEYTTRRVYFLHTFTWICNVFGIFFILAAHEHYSIDVFIAFYISTRLFLYYHTLANNKGSSRIGQRAWFYFPLFYFFEANVDGKVPNVFEWPIRIEDLKSLSQKILSYLPDEKLFMSPKPKESFDAGLRQSSQDGPVPAQANDKKKD